MRIKTISPAPCHVCGKMTDQGIGKWPKCKRHLGTRSNSTWDVSLYEEPEFWKRTYPTNFITVRRDSKGLYITDIHGAIYRAPAGFSIPVGARLQVLREANYSLVKVGSESIRFEKEQNGHN